VIFDRFWYTKTEGGDLKALVVRLISGSRG